MKHSFMRIMFHIQFMKLKGLVKLLLNSGVFQKPQDLPEPVVHTLLFLKN